MSGARWRPLVAPGLATLLVGAMLVTLGIWQLHRLVWKEGILAQIDARTHAAPQAVPPRSQWPELKPKDYEYRRVTVKGRFRNDAEAYVFRGGDLGAGYLIMTPLDLDGGGTVLVNRGFVPEELRDPAKRRAGEPEGEVSVTGLMRQPEPRNLFTPADEPEKDVFFTRDPEAIAGHLGLKQDAPFTLDADATPNPGGWPQGGTTVVAIPNNHFSYALTWFGLALGLIGVFCSYAWRRLHEPDGNPDDEPTA